MARLFNSVSTRKRGQPLGNSCLDSLATSGLRLKGGLRFRGYDRRNVRFRQRARDVETRAAFVREFQIQDTS